MSDRKRVTLAEYETVRLGRGELNEETAMQLWQGYGRQLEIESPGFRTEHKWQLTARGWVGQIPVGPDLELMIAPKVPIRNLFGMLEYAYRMRGFKILEGLTECESLQEFYEVLAGRLASMVSDQLGRGLYRSYVGHDSRLSYVRGRIDLSSAMRQPGNPRLPCRFQEHTADIEDNQIPAWTLKRITRGGMCTERVLPRVRNACRTLSSHVSPVAFSGQSCIGRTYNPLNESYREIHALCRFFIESSGPGINEGGYEMLPFLVDMGELFELFVAEWLKAHAPGHLEIKTQDDYSLDQAGRYTYRIDIVVRDLRDGAVKCILDTKYKDPANNHPAPADVHQVVHYAVAKAAPLAILLYPSGSDSVFFGQTGPVQIHRMAFNLSGNLEDAGTRFLDNLLPLIA